MFKPTSSKDRINYGEMLMPPVGYRLERAVGTTYSLDLDTLTAVAISLGLIADTDSELMSNPISMLNALQKVSERIIIFCEAGQIKMPAKGNALYLMLEKMVVPVKLPYDTSINRYQAFHPKTWLLQYVDAEGIKEYRYVIMSRNLTFDHSWDVACKLDGEITDGISQSSVPVIRFLDFLKKQIRKEFTNSERQLSDIDVLKNDVKHVNFVTGDRDFSSAEILPLGIGNGSYDMAGSRLFKGNFHDLVIMSPFLTGSVIEDFNQSWKALTGCQRTLITRRSELHKIKDGQASGFNVYVMKDDIVDGEDAISDGGVSEEVITPTKERSSVFAAEEINQANKQDIHAKIYLRRKHGTTDLYLGSMNASFAAIHSNVEMMLHLVTKNGVLNGSRFLDDIMGENPKKNPFELADLAKVYEPSEQEPRDKAEQMIKKICRIPAYASVASDGSTYTLHVEFKAEISIEGAMIRPLQTQGSKAHQLEKIIDFTSLGLLQLSEFYILTVTADDCTLERIITIPTAGLPDRRNDEIIKSVIKDKKSFIEYVAFVLGDDYIQSYLENKLISSGDAYWDNADAVPAVYEKMLRTSFTDPTRLKDLKRITSAIEEDDIIPPEFRDMYRVFCETLELE